MTPMERLAMRSDTTDAGCRLWAGAKRKGYGAIWVDGRVEQTHVLAYTVLVGPICPGQLLDHLCHNVDPTCPGGPVCIHRACWEVGHLELTDSRSNTLRSSVSTAGANARKTHCANGHEFTTETTHISPDGKRRCRPCDRDRMARKYAEGLQQSALHLLDQLIAVGSEVPS